MNDATNLYLALRVGVADLGYSAFDGVFMPSELNPFGPGNDILRATPTLFEDYHYQQTGPNTWDWITDVADGGTRDGTAAATQNSDYGVFEVSHPLDTADNAHDFSLPIFSHISFIASFQHCVAGSCGHTIVPDFGTIKVVAVSGTHVPPETTITAGPRDGAEVPDYGLFEFKGTDDVAPPSELTFECKVDGDEWSECFSPYGPDTIAEGWHTLNVRALDEMGNADPTPAHRRWRIDTLSPSKPRVARVGRATFRFSATDRGTPSRRLRFRCAIDSKRLHTCGSRVRWELPARRHVVRVRAVDPAGNESDVKTVRFTVSR
jgi:hypothetical protein